MFDFTRIICWLICGSHISCCSSSTVIDAHLHKAQMYVSRCAKLQMSFCQAQHDMRYLKNDPQSKHYHALSSLASSVASTFVNVASAHARKYLLHSTRSLCSILTWYEMGITFFNTQLYVRTVKRVLVNTNLLWSH